MQRLAIVTTHPIQYYAPIFSLLHQKGLNIKIFYTWGRAALENKHDPDFGKSIQWDIPLLEGYEYVFCENSSSKPGSHHYNGIVNPNLIKMILTYKATHILVFGWNFKSHLQVMKYFKGKIPVLFRGDSTLIDQSKGLSVKSIGRKLVLQWIYKHVDMALYVGTANKAYYQSVGMKELQLVFAPHAIDNQRFSQINPEQKEWIVNTQQNAGMDQTDLSIVFCGKFQDKKNPLLLIQAFHQLQQKNIHLFMVGDGVLEAELKKAAICNKNIHFLSFQNQSLMPAVYRLGDVFCLPSQGPGETWGLAVNEAMACSKAVLVSDKCGCAADLVKEGVNGYIFKSGDLNDLTAKLSVLLSVGKHQLAKMEEASFEMIHPWSFETIASTIVSIMHSDKKQAQL